MKNLDNNRNQYREPLTSTSADDSEANSKSIKPYVIDKNIKNLVLEVSNYVNIKHNPLK